MKLKLKASVNMDDLRDVNKALKELPRASQRNVIVRVLRKRAKPMQAAAQANAPVRSGALRKTIVIGTRLKNQAGKAEYAAAMRAGLGKAAALQAMRDARRAAAGDTVAVVYVGSTSPLAHLTEWGSAHNRAIGWMRAAYDAHAAGTFDGISADILAEIDKAVARRAARAARKAAKTAGG